MGFGGVRSQRNLRRCSPAVGRSGAVAARFRPEGRWRNTGRTRWSFTQLSNAEGKSLLSACCECERDSGLSLMWLELKANKQKADNKLAACLLPNGLPWLRCSTKAFLAGVGAAAQSKSQKSWSSCINEGGWVESLPAILVVFVLLVHLHGSGVTCALSDGALSSVRSVH